jgi:hypothetical protein
MINTLLKAYALGMCLLTASILGITCSGPLWEIITELVLHPITYTDLYRYYRMEPLCLNCAGADAAQPLASAPAIPTYAENTLTSTPKVPTLQAAEPIAEEVPPPLVAPLLTRLGIALLAILVGFNHWRFLRYLSQPPA